MNFSGIILGASAFLCIGIFHPIVIKCEYYFSYKVWPVFAFAGLAALVISAFVNDTVLSSVVGVFGFSCLWSILELFKQKERVEKGWFPENPKRHRKEKQQKKST